MSSTLSSSPVSRESSLLWAKTTTDRSLLEAQPNDPRLAYTRRNPHGLRYPVGAHSVDSGIIGEWLYRNWLSPQLRAFLASALGLSEEDTAPLVATWCGRHDVGKISHPFVSQIRHSASYNRWGAELLKALGADFPSVTEMDVPPLGYRHEYIGFHCVTGEVPTSDMFAADFPGALTTYIHHGQASMPDAQANAYVARANRYGWKREQQVLLAQICELFGVSAQVADAPLADDKHAGLVVLLLTGIVQLADWLASQDAVVNSQIKSPWKGAVDWAERHRAGLHRHCAKILGEPGAGFDADIEDVFGEKEPTALQQWAYEAAREHLNGNLVFVEYPTGEGKTLFAIALNHLVRQRLFFTSPSMSTTDEMERRGHGMLGPRGRRIVKSHSLATSLDGDWFNSSIRRSLAPVVFGTIDQVLRAGLRQKNLPLRLLGVLNSHIVLDEAHTYDHYMMELLRTVITAAGAVGTPVTVMTATNQRWKRNVIGQAYCGNNWNPGEWHYPQAAVFDREGRETGGRLTAAGRTQRPFSFRVHRTHDHAESLMEWVMARRAAFPRAHLAAVVHNKDLAIDLARQLRCIPSAGRVILLHADMTGSLRNQITSELESLLGPEARGVERVTVIATQMIQAGSDFDFDFDFIATTLKPGTDLIQLDGRRRRFLKAIERIRRLGEQEGTSPGYLDIFAAVSEETGLLLPRAALPYPLPELNRTLDALDSAPAIDGCKVVADAQQFVDNAALDLEEWAKHVDSFSAPDREVARALVMVSEARKNTIKTSGRFSDFGENCTIERLHHMTNLDDSELSHIAPTRSIDIPQGTYLLINRDYSQHVSPLTIEEIAVLGTREAAREVSLHSLSTSFSRHDALAEAAEKTLQAAAEKAPRLPGAKKSWSALCDGEWAPESSVLRGVRVVDLAYLEQFEFDDRDGLAKIEEDAV